MRQVYRSDDFNITREDVPYLSRAWALWAQMGVEVLVWIVGWSAMVEYRPGVIEIIVGVAFAVPVGLLYARSGIAQLRAASARSRLEVGPSFFPFCPDAGIKEYFIAITGAFFACLLLVGAIYVIFLAFQGLDMPWAHFNIVDVQRADSGSGSYFPYQSVIAASTAYFLTNIVVVQGMLLRWYNNLPATS